MLAQRARLLALYAGLIYNSWKHKITTKKPNMSKTLHMIFFINSGEKSSQPKNIPSLQWRSLSYFIGKNPFSSKNKKDKKI